MGNGRSMISYCEFIMYKSYACYCSFPKNITGNYSKLHKMEEKETIYYYTLLLPVLFRKQMRWIVNNAGIHTTMSENFVNRKSKIVSQMWTRYELNGLNILIVFELLFHGFHFPCPLIVTNGYYYIRTHDSCETDTNSQNHFIVKYQSLCIHCLDIRSFYVFTTFCTFFHTCTQWKSRSHLM